jgi:hypothetical protein
MKFVNKFIFGMFLILVFLIGVGSAYMSSNSKFIESRGSVFQFDELASFNNDMCQEGTDFVVQIPPMGCTPVVVRSDLLEEQDVPVFCELSAIKINPLINIKAIDSINIAGEYPPQVRTVGFHPSYSALGENRKLNNLMWDNIGYAVIWLRQQKESDLVNCKKEGLSEICRVTGNLSAKMIYDLEGAFGLRKHLFYLPVMTDSEFSSRYGQYAFFDRRGFLRAENVDQDSASIVIYSGRNENLFGMSKAGQDNKQKLYQLNLNVGETSSEMFLPGFDCLATVKFRLERVESASTRAKLLINSEAIEVKEDEAFLDNKCEITAIEKMGLNQKVRVSCRGDERTKILNLRINPSISLSVDGTNKNKKVGEYLFSDEGKHIYLAYVGTKEGTGKKEDLVAYVVAVPNRVNEDDSSKDVLSEAELKTAAHLIKSLGKDEGNAKDYLHYISGWGTNFYKWVVDGDNFKYLTFGEEEELFKHTLKIIDFGSELNLPLEKETEDRYLESLDNYDKVLSNFLGEKYADGTSEGNISLDERALYGKILLADSVHQKHDVRLFCDEFLEGYSDSNLNVDICYDLIKMANTELSEDSVLIDGNWKSISLERIHEPDYKDHGIEITIKNGSESENYNLRKDQIFYLDDVQYIRLIEVHEDQAKIQFHLLNESTGKKVFDFLGSEGKIISKNSPISFGSDYTFILKETYLTQLARVSVIPNINYAGSTVDFTFNVGVEKRAIQLSPEKTQNRIEKLNKTIESWKKRSEALGTVVETMKKACLGVGATLTLKNLVFGAKGKTIAREEVMYGANGWYEQCGDEKYGGQKYSSEEECLFKNADLIDKEVNEIVREMTAQNNKIKQIQKEFTTERLLSQSVVNTEEFVEVYSGKVNESISWLNEEEVYNSSKINLDNVQGVLDKSHWERGVYSIDQAKKIELYSNLLKGDKNNQNYKSRLLKALTDVETNSKEILDLENLQKSVLDSGLSKSVPRIYSNEKTKEEIYDGDLVPKGFGGDLPEGKPVQTIVYESDFYYVVLNATNNDQYYIWKVYLENKTTASDKISKLIVGKYSFFKKYDSSSYENPYDKNNLPKLTYYETDPYKGLPAMVPFDSVHGWYAFVKQTIPTGRTIRAYDDSGKINSFWLCNVGQNHLAQFENNLGDDICRQINLGIGDLYNDFPGLDSSESKSLINEAEKAIFQASRAYGDGVKKVTILDKMFEVGSPAMDIPGIKCTDYMSPKDCKLLFNVCDPVICPNSRCDFGGSYPVADVIQSGIIGSVALCLPNWNEGIRIPVCLTGVKAGVDGYLSIAQAYHDCLEHNLETGETVGICDEIHSIYLCEFFWRQAFPLAKLAVPKIMGIITGQNSRGGGEYMGIQAAWENAKNSISYFTQYYAVNSYKAFKARSTEEVGSAACGSFVSVAYPEGQGILDMLTESDSPPQFNAKFDAIPFTTATVPPITHYKVFYHIYAGNDRGAYYKVYLRGEPGGSYYQGTGFGKSVASGYIAKGDYASETVDFTGPEGYKELCVVVNDQEECGFQQVTSNFALDYIKDQYIENQATSKDIKSEEECVSGTPNVYSLLNPLNLNVQEGVDSLIDPAIYEKGLIRICSTDNPGEGGEDAEWFEVGNCGNEKIKCWLNKESIDDAVEDGWITEDQILKELEGNVSEFLKEKGYMTPEVFSSFLDEIKEEKDQNKNIKTIEGIFEKIFLNNQKGYLYYLLGGFYGELAEDAFDRLDKVKIKKEEEGKGDVEVEEGLCRERKLVLEKMKYLEGKSREGNILNVDNENGISCFDGAFSPHAFVDLSGGTLYDQKYCLYTAGENIEFEVLNEAGDKTILDDFGLDGYYSCTSEVSSSCEYKGKISEGDKLNLLKTGDVISYASEFSNKKGPYVPHNAVFIDWNNREKWEANLFDWNGIGQTYRFYTADISDSGHPVYQIWSIPCTEEEIGSFEGGLPSGYSFHNIYESSSFISPVIEYKDVSVVDPNFNFQYVRGIWKVKKGEDSSTLFELTEENIEKKGGSDKKKIFLRKFISANYIDGLNVLLNKISSQKIGTFTSLPFTTSGEEWLSVYSIIFDYDGIYNIKLEDSSVKELNFRFHNGKWEWKTWKDETWYDTKFFSLESVSEEYNLNYGVDSYIYIKQIPDNYWTLIQILSLIGEDLEGAAIIFGGENFWKSYASDLQIDSSKKFIVGEETYSSYEEIPWTLDSAIKFISSNKLSGQYKDNKEFIDSLFGRGFFTYGEYDDIRGEGGAFWGVFQRENYIFEVTILLKELKSKDEQRTKWTFKTAYEESRDFSGTYPENDEFVNELYRDGLIEDRYFIEYQTEGLGGFSQIMDTLRMTLFDKMTKEDDLVFISEEYINKNDLAAFKLFVTKNGLDLEDELSYTEIDEGFIVRYDGSGKELKDVSSLSNLAKIKGLILSDNEIEDISSFSGLSTLESFAINSNFLNDLVSLKNLQSLTFLNVEENCLENEDERIYFEGKIGENFYYQGNPRGDCYVVSCELVESGYSDFKYCKEELEIFEKFVSDHDLLVGGDTWPNDQGHFESIRLYNRNQAEISVNEISSWLENFRFLKRVDLEDGFPSDLSYLKNLENLESLWIMNNEIIDLTPLENLINLKDIMFDDNQITDITSLEKLVNLEKIHLSNNYISDISPLRNLDLKILGNGKYVLRVDENCLDENDPNIQYFKDKLGSYFTYSGNPRSDC